MNILFLSEYFYPRLAGGELISWRLCNALTRRGHRINVVTSRMKDASKYEEKNNIKIHRPLRSGGSVVGRAVFSAKLSSYLGKFLERKRDIDLIYNLGYLPTIPAIHVGSRNDIPVVTSVRSLLGKTWFKLADPFSATFNYLMEKFVIRLAKRSVLHFPCEYTRRKAGLSTEARSVVIYNFVDEKEIKEIKKESDVETIRRKGLGIKKGTLFLLFVGSLLPVKNVKGLVESLGKLKREFKLALIGDGPEREKIEKLIRNLGLGGQVSLLGQKPRGETLAMMHACDILVLPSKSEQFPNVVLEALAFGKPVVATNVGGIPEIKSNNLHVVDSLEEMIEKLESAPKSESKGREILKEYSKEKIVREFEALFEEAIRKSSRSR